MTGLTDQWLRTEFQDHARTIDPPADLHRESMRRARATRKRRKGLQAAFTVGLAAAATGVIVIVTGALPPSSTPTPAGPAPATWTFDLYFVDMGGINSTQRPTLVSEPVTVPNTGDKPLDIANALMGSVAEGEGTNGFNYSSNGQYPIAQVNAVTVEPNAITVDLDRDVWDPYPNVDCQCPPGDMVTQQLVWTLNSALDSTAPVLLTINGEPARGIWLHKLDGPVSMESQGVTTPRSLGDTLECPPHSLTGGTIYDGPGTGGHSTPDEALVDVLRMDFRQEGWSPEDFQTLSNSPFQITMGVKDNAGDWIALIRITQGTDDTWTVSATATCQQRSQ